MNVLEGRQGVAKLPGRNLKKARRGNGRERVGHIVTSRQGKFERGVQLRPRDVKLTSPGWRGMHILNSEVRALTEAKGHNSPLETVRKPAHALVVMIQHGRSRRSQVLNQLVLGSRNRLEGVKELQVHGSDVGEDPHLRLRDLCEQGNLARRGHRQFQHRRLVVRFKRQQGQGQAVIVVQVPGRFVHPQAFTQDGRDHLLGGGLPRAPGNRYHPLSPFSPHRPGQMLQRLYGVPH